MQALLRTGVLEPTRSFFDYGCGKGDDVAGLCALGITASGWDPYYAADRPIVTADIVNLGFVINVIEDLEERIAAVQTSFSLARRALSVSAMLTSNAAMRGRRYRDGVVTSRNTFQKYFEQQELQNFIEAVLDEQAIPAGPGIFFVFPDPELEQRFLLKRQTDPTRAPRLLAQRARKRVRSPDSGNNLDVEGSSEKYAILDHLWERALELGRIPEEDELEDSLGVSACFGSWRRAITALLARSNPEDLETASAARREEIRVLFALEAFARKKPFRAFSPTMQRDIKHHFGSLLVAQMEGKRLLKECADPALIQSAAIRAAECGLGFLDREHSLQLHSSMAARLPPVLKAYLGCATALYGDVSSADLVKIHIASGKVTLMKFDDFELLLPRMTERVKVRLKDQDIDVFAYGAEYEPPFLFYKSRYINEEFPGYAKQLSFDQALEELCLPDGDGFGPSPKEVLGLVTCTATRG